LKLMSFAVNRVLVDTDEPYADEILAEWTTSTPTLRALIKAVVTNDTFKWHHKSGSATTALDADPSRMERLAASPPRPMVQWALRVQERRGKTIAIAVRPHRRG
jgi:hypothetical protein